MSRGGSRRPALRRGGAGAGEKPTAGADPEPGRALPGPGGPAAAAGPDRSVAGKLLAPAAQRCL